MDGVRGGRDSGVDDVGGISLLCLMAEMPIWEVKAHFLRTVAKSRETFHSPKPLGRQDKRSRPWASQIAWIIELSPLSSTIVGFRFRRAPLGCRLAPLRSRKHPFIAVYPNTIRTYYGVQTVRLLPALIRRQDSCL